MKLSKLPIAMALLGAAMMASPASWAHGGGHHHGHAGVGVVIGGPIWPWYYSYPPSYYYYPPVVTVPVEPPVYIEKSTETPPAESYWYYCNSSKTYYPYVQQCPEGWRKIAPQPTR